MEQREFGEYKECLVTTKGLVGLISINRPTKFNSLSMGVMDELIQAFRQFDQDEDVEVIILKGEEGVFCTGHDIDDILGKDREEMAEVFAKPSEVYQTIQSIGKPVVAAVQGYAMAMGAGLAGACDIIICSDDAQFQTPGAGFGIPCGTPTLGLYRSVNRKRFMEMLFTAEPIDAVQAQQMGLVNRVVPWNKLEDEVMELAQKIASRSPTAIRASKRLYYQLAGIDHAIVGKQIGDIMAMCADCDDVREWLPLMKKGASIDRLPKRDRS